MECTGKNTAAIGDFEYISKEAESGRNTFASICQEFEHQCSGNPKEICQEYEAQKDETVCKLYGWTCQQSLVPNPACQSECDRKQNEYESIKSESTFIIFP